METDQVCVKTEEEEKADDVASFPSAETSCIKHIKTERYVFQEQNVRSCQNRKVGLARTES